MLIDSNAMERTFQRFFALQAERLCQLQPVYVECFLECLKRQYQTIHRLETNKLRNTAKFFAHLLYTGMFFSFQYRNSLLLLLERLTCYSSHTVYFIFSFQMRFPGKR